MNNLIYFALPRVSSYDNFLTSPEYQHNKWFTLFNTPLWPMHTTSRVHKLDTPWALADTICPIPAITNNELNFDRVIESIAEDFCRLVDKTGKTPYICWSGGIDSTSILVSVLKVGSPEFLKKLIILHSDQSISENAYFYYNYIDKKLNTENIDSFVINQENYNNCIVVDGEAGNQTMGHNSVQKLLYNQQYDLLDQPWTNIKNLSELLLGATDFIIQLVKESILHAPIPIITGYDFLWWVNFNFKFDDVLIRKVPAYTRNLTSEQTKVFYEESLYRFYAQPSMQIWSMLTKDLRREGLKITPKYVPKKYIYEFDRNDFWFYNKREEGSKTDVLFNLVTTPLVAIDSNWHKYSIADKDTRIKLGKLLKRI